MRGYFRRLVAACVDQVGIGTGLRWKLSAAIALVGALVAVALSLVVHNAARVSMLDNARDLADERIMIAQRNYELSGRLNFPNTKILLLAIFPRGFPGDPVRDRIAECNRIIQKLDDGKSIFYMDIGAKFLAEDGTLDATMPDRLHPNAVGYDIWGEAVKAKLAELMK